jgi:hypothetical protein
LFFGDGKLAADLFYHLFKCNFSKFPLGLSIVTVLISEVLITIHVDDGGAAVILKRVVAAIAERELFGLPATAKGDRFTLDNGDMRADMAIFLVGFVLVFGH